MEEGLVYNINFNQIAKEWLQFKKTKIKESTYLNYKFIINKSFTRELGEKTLYELLKYNFNEFIEKQMKGLSSKTVKDEVTILKGILKYTETKYEVNFKLDLISSPTIYKKEIEIFNERERKKLEKYCMKNKNIKNLGLLISLYTGLRIGEVCALKWKNIDFENKLLYVTNTLQRVYQG